MAVTLVATAGASNANSYLTEAEATAYFDTRLFSEAWDLAADKPKALMFATRVLDSALLAYKRFVPEANGVAAHYRSRPAWSGTPSTTTQALAWPRTGMYDANGNAIAVDAIPQALKNAVAELALQLLGGDRTLDNDVIVQGLSSLRVGPASFSFKDNIEVKVIPDAAWNLMPPSWFTEELIEAVAGIEFCVMDEGSR